AVAYLSEPPDNLNIKSNIHAFGSAEHQFSTAEVAQTEGNKNDSISAMTEMSAVRDDITDFIDTEEEPEFILTLVEISPDSVECNNIPAALAHGSGELLPPPILFTSDNMDSLELTRDKSVGSIQASVEESVASVTDPTEIELHPSSSEQLVDLGLTPWKNWKRSSISIEGSSASEKIRHTVPIEEHLESSDKGTSLNLQYISRKDAELQVEEKEQLQSSLNVGTALLGETDSEAELVSRMPGAGKAETNKEQRLSVAYSSEQSEQVRNTEALSKTSLPRYRDFWGYFDNFINLLHFLTLILIVFNMSYQRSLGFLPLICKINTDEEIAAKENNKPPQKTCTLIFENTPECPASTSKDSNTEIQEYSSLPTTMLSPSKYESGNCSSVQVLPEEEGSAKEQEKEEQIRISEYFFSDIFMEVDDSE
ncbi:Transcription factor TFIIIB component B''-like protein, partial [Ophiophagus hannah]